MKSGFLALVLLCGVSVAFAQTPSEPPSGPPNAAHQLDRLTTLLDLTDTQKAQVKTILDAEHAKMRAQFQAAKASGTKPSFDEMRAACETIGLRVTGNGTALRVCADVGVLGTTS